MLRRATFESVQSGPSFVSMGSVVPPEINVSRARRRGPKPLPAGEKRTHCVSVWCNDSELACIDAHRGKYQRGEWVRMVSVDQVRPSVEIPTLNQEAYSLLAKTAGNLATVANAMRGGAFVEVATLRHAINEIRRALIGAGAALDAEGDLEGDA